MYILRCIFLPLAGVLLRPATALIIIMIIIIIRKIVDAPKAISLDVQDRFSSVKLDWVVLHVVCLKIQKNPKKNANLIS